MAGVGLVIAITSYYYYLYGFKSVGANLGELEPSADYQASSGPGERLSIVRSMGFDRVLFQ